MIMTEEQLMGLLRYIDARVNAANVENDQLRGVYSAVKASAAFNRLDLELDNVKKLFLGEPETKESSEGLLKIMSDVMSEPFLDPVTDELTDEQWDVITKGRTGTPPSLRPELVICDDPVPETFKREERYIVVKKKDLTSQQDRFLGQFLQSHQIPTRECVVVESDWSIYETVWAMIEKLESEKK